MRFTMLFGALALTSVANAQSEIYGVDVFNMQTYMSTADANFVTNLVNIGPKTTALFALDFDATATDLWAIDNASGATGTVDLTTGLFSPTGTTSGIPVGNVTGLTAATDGSTWYASHFDGVNTNLWVGDITTGAFTLVGTIATGIVIDISISSTDAIYGLLINTSSLYSIDSTTGAGTLVGPTGTPTNFAQGLDFDWSDDTLYAAMFNNLGAGNAFFSTLDLTTGVATQLVDTGATNGEFEMAVRSAAGSTGVAYCFGDGTGTACPCGNTGGAGEGCANGGGSGGVVEGSGGTSVAGSTNLLASNLRPNQPALGFGGLQALNGGNGVIFGDGLRCAGSGVVRLGTRVPDANGDANWMDIATLGGYSAGDQRFFQVWYRDPAGSPCGAAFNLTNGYEITFTP